MIKRVLGIIMMGICSMTLQGQTIEGFVTGLLQQYPEARLLDIYKSCFQDYMGAEHLVSETAAVKSYLDQELATTTADGLLPWYWEPCGIYGNYVRVSLRAVHEGLISADALLDAFIASADCACRPAVADWAAQWKIIIKVLDQMNLNLPDYDEDKRFIDSVLSQGKYAISHSSNYRDAYAPHYRIVRRDLFTREIAPFLPK